VSASDSDSKPITGNSDMADETGSIYISETMTRRQNSNDKFRIFYHDELRKSVGK